MEIKNRYTNEVIWKNDDIDTFASFDFGGANLTEANLSWANLTGANLSSANLTNTQLPNPNDILKQNFKFNELGMIVYKMFGNTSYTPNKDWKIEENSMISETCNWNRQDACGCGVNFGTEEWVKENYPNNDLWECLVPIEYLMGIVVPLNFEGKARCSNLILIKKIS